MIVSSRKVRGAAGLAGAVAMAASLYVALTRIEPLLPPENGSVCFAGTFAGDQSLVLGYPREKRSEEARVTAMRLRIDRRGGQEPYRAQEQGWGYDWQYDLRLEITAPDRSFQGSGAQCAWLAHPISHVVPDLGCYIDCDGGGIWLWRVPGRSAIDVVWDAENWLRMTGCSGGEILRAGSTTKTFRVARTSCAGTPQPDS